MLKKISAYTLILTMVLSMIGGINVWATEEPGVVYKFDLTTTNTYNTGANDNTTVAPIEDGGMHLTGSGIWYSTQTAPNGYGSSLCVANAIDRIVFKVKLGADVTESKFLTFYLNWVGLNDANYQQIISDDIIVEPGSEYQTYICDVADAIAAYENPAYPVRQMGINNNDADMYISEIKFVDATWTEPEEEIIPKGPGAFVSSSPANNAINVSQNADLKLTFDNVPVITSFTRDSVVINESHDMVEAVGGQTGLSDFVIYDNKTDPYSLTINLKPLESGTRYIVELSNIVVGESTLNERIVFITGFDGTPTQNALYEYDLTTTNTFNIGINDNTTVAPIENGGMRLSPADHADCLWYSTQYSPDGYGTAIISTLSDIKKIIVRAKITDTEARGFSIYLNWTAHNSANYNNVASFDITIQPGDAYVDYIIDTSSLVSYVNPDYPIRQIALVCDNATDKMYIQNIKFVPAGYTDVEYLAKGFEMVQDYGSADERNISYIGLPDNPGDVSATLNYFYNFESKPVTVCIVAALYNSNVLEDIAYEKIEIPAGGSIRQPMVATLYDIPTGENYIVKGFLWKDMQPLQENHTLTHAKKVLILGNSITYHPTTDFSESYGVIWNGSWGMAVTSEENDYVHLLMKYAKDAGYHADIRVGGNIWRTDRTLGSIETNPTLYMTTADLDDSTAKEFAEFKPDIIINALGANNTDVDNFITVYENAMEYIAPNAKVITVGTICGSAPWEKVSALAAEKGWPYVDRTEAAGYATGTYMANSIWGANAIGWHPGNNGMRAIADGIWAYLEGYLAE